VIRKKYALATLLFGQRTLYKTMAKILFDSARRYGFLANADPVLLTTEHVEPAEFARWDVRIVRVPKRDYPKRYNGPVPELYNKFECFNLLDYEKVLFSDADAYVYDSDRLLFQLPSPTFLIEEHVPLATGNMLVTPNKGLYAELTKLAVKGHYDPVTGWEHCGAAPPWPQWHRAMFWRKYCEQLAPLVREHTWNFLYSGAEQGLLYYYFNYCHPGYLCYHFPAFRHLAGDQRAEILLHERKHAYWEVAADAGLTDELLAACEQDVEFRYGTAAKPSVDAGR
jgi:hypothetical protein